MNRLVVLFAVPLLAAGCGPAPDLNKAATRLGVLTGGLDPTLIGTFRLYAGRTPAKGMLELLVLRTDLSFHARYVAACAEDPCEGVVEIDGQYRQKRELPNLSRASKISLTGWYLDPVTGEDAMLFLVLERGWVEGSPLISLYHVHEGEGDAAVPFFELTHPRETWCAQPVDCDLQDTENACGSFACEQSLCSCR